MLKSFLTAGVVEAGCDEAGRGCLAGPVTAAAVILPADFSNDLINDSKQLTEKRREALRPVIESQAVAWAVAHVGPEEIDRINILRASILAMHRAIGKLAVRPQALIVDGNRFFQFEDLPHTTIIKGDAKFMSIAAASILAKTHRDELMATLHEQFPQYNWKKNKGYPTRDHRQAIAQYGITPHHRRSFQMLKQRTLLDIFPDF